MEFLLQLEAEFIRDTDCVYAELDGYYNSEVILCLDLVSIVFEKGNLMLYL